MGEMRACVRVDGRRECGCSQREGEWIALSIFRDWNAACSRSRDYLRRYFRVSERFFVFFRFVSFQERIAFNELLHGFFYTERQLFS